MEEKDPDAVFLLEIKLKFGTWSVFYKDCVTGIKSMLIVIGLGKIGVEDSPFFENLTFN